MTLNHISEFFLLRIIARNSKMKFIVIALFASFALCTPVPTSCLSLDETIIRLDEAICRSVSAKDTFDLIEQNEIQNIYNSEKIYSSKAHYKLLSLNATYHLVEIWNTVESINQNEISMKQCTHIFEYLGICESLVEELDTLIRTFRPSYSSINCKFIPIKRTKRISKIPLHSLPHLKSKFEHPRQELDRSTSDKSLQDSETQAMVNWSDVQTAYSEGKCDSFVLSELYRQECLPFTIDSTPTLNGINQSQPKQQNLEEVLLINMKRKHEAFDYYWNSEEMLDIDHSTLVDTAESKESPLKLKTATF